MTAPILSCPFCGGKAKVSKRIEDSYDDSGKLSTRKEQYRIYCVKCSCGTGWCFYPEDAKNNWNTRYKETAVYDQEETVEGCTVQILTNSVTGEHSVGWWRGKKEDMPKGGAE